MPSVDGKEWKFEHQYEYNDGWSFYDAKIIDPIIVWCQEHKRRDPDFEWTFRNGKVAPIAMETVATDVGLAERYSIKTTILGSFFYFQREQDFMLFKLSWA